jgi:hypothetical protein
MTIRKAKWNIRMAQRLDENWECPDALQSLRSFSHFQTRKQLATVRTLGQLCLDAETEICAWSMVWKAVVVLRPDALSFRLDAA